MDPVLKLDNDPIQFVKEANNWFDLEQKTHLSTSYQILQSMVSKSLNIPKALSRAEWGADRTTLL